MRTKQLHARRSAGAGEIKEIDMIEIKYLRAESGANKFGTCNCCGKSSSEDPLMISVKFSYYGHGTLICLCDDCKKKLIEALPPANSSETPNNSDTISRAKAIAEVEKARAYIGHRYNVESMVGRDIFEMLDGVVLGISKLPPAQPERIKGRWIIKNNTERFIAQCNCCRYIEDSRRIKNFCPNCGAEMEVTT